MYILNVSKATWVARGGNEETVCYSPLPLFHLNTPANTILGAYIGGATAAIDSTFTVSRFWDRIRLYKATQTCLIGSMITMLWSRPSSPNDSDNSLEILFGAPVPADIHEQFEDRFGLRILTLFGLTEAFPITLSSVELPPTPGTSGKTYEAYDVRLVDVDENEVGPGQPGELTCRPRRRGAMFSGYWKNPEGTLKALEDLWFHTGDICRFDEDDNLIFVDRIKDTIRRRGENISSYEVEQALRLHPAVADVAAHGVPSPVSEEDVKICVVLKEDSAVTPQELYYHCIEVMPRYALPRYIEIVDELPVSQVGRVLKYVLRERGVTAETWDHEGT